VGFGGGVIRGGLRLACIHLKVTSLSLFLFASEGSQQNLFSSPLPHPDFNPARFQPPLSFKETSSLPQLHARHHRKHPCFWSLVALFIVVAVVIVMVVVMGVVDGHGGGGGGQ
jgi:hypothetical protein